MHTKRIDDLSWVGNRRILGFRRVLPLKPRRECMACIRPDNRSDPTIACLVFVLGSLILPTPGLTLMRSVSRQSTTTTPRRHLPSSCYIHYATQFSVAAGAASDRASSPRLSLSTAAAFIYICVMPITKHNPTALLLLLLSSKSVPCQ